MITLNADSLLASVETLKLKGLEMRAAARDSYRSQILEIFYQLLLITPQYSSDMVSNWDLVVEGANEHEYSRSSEKVEWAGGRGHKAPHERGEVDAGLLSAYARARAKTKNIKYYGQPVYFVNASMLEIDTPSIVNVADGSVQELRDGAVVFAWVSITSYLQARFGS